MGSLRGEFGRSWRFIPTRASRAAKGRADRPGLDDMLNAAIKGGFDVVMAWSIDRLGRSLIDLLGTIQHLEACGCHFVSRPAIDRHDHTDWPLNVPDLRGVCRVRALHDPATHQRRSQPRQGAGKAARAAQGAKRCRTTGSTPPRQGSRHPQGRKSCRARNRHRPAHQAGNGSRPAPHKVQA